MKPTAIIGLILVTTLILLSSYLRLAPEAQEVMSWARPIHRLIASTIGLLVLGLVGLSLQRRQNRTTSFVLLGLTVFLAWLGIYSQGLHSPAIVMGNQGGGFAMLGVFAWLIFTCR
jgi:heme A synthase